VLKTALMSFSKCKISKHLKNIFKEGDLDETATICKMETVQIEGG